MSEYYARPGVSPGDSISWSELSRTQEIRILDDDYRWVTETGIAFTPLPYCTFGDYDNSTAVERSNARVMRERFPQLVHVTGDYGSEMVGYLGSLEDQEDDLREAIADLQDYPIADEQDECDLEMEMEWLAWCDWGRRDFAKDLTGVLDEIDPEHEHEIETPPYGSGTDTKSPLDTIWHDGCDAYNVNGGGGMVIECGGNVHFYIDEWCKRATDTEDARYPWSDYARGARRKMRDQLHTLAVESRIKDES